MKTLLVFIFLVIKIAQSYPSGGCPNCNTITGPTQEPVPCTEALDYCADLVTVWKTGNFRMLTDPTTFVSCTGTEHISCFRCPQWNSTTFDKYLFFSEKCNECTYYENEDDNICTTTAPTRAVTTAPYIMDFCQNSPQNGQVVGNVVDPASPYGFYQCVWQSTYYQSCQGLVYNQTCNACL